MAQLTMQRHNPITYEGRVSISQASEIKISSYKALKSEPTDHFQKNIPERNVPEVDNKKIADRGLKRSQNINEAKTDQPTSKKLKSPQLEKQTQPSETHKEPMVPVAQNESIEDNLLSFSPAEEVELEFNFFSEQEEIKTSIPAQENKSFATDRLAKQKLQEDLASIAALEEQQITPTEINSIAEQSLQLVQMEPSPEFFADINGQTEESNLPQITNSLLSAAQIDNKQSISPNLALRNEAEEVQIESTDLFPLTTPSDDSDLKEMLKLKVDDKETIKHKKSKNLNQESPEQLSFAFIEQPAQEIKIVTATSVPQESSVQEVEIDGLKTQQKPALQIDSADIDIAEQTDRNKGISSSAEPTLITSANDKVPEAFRIAVNSTSSAPTSITNAASPTPSIIAASLQTAPEQVAVKLITALNNGDDQIHIRLTPEDLGEITIKLNISDNRVNALIQSDNAETLKLLQKDSQTLENTLKDSGFTLESHNMEFSFSGGSSKHDQTLLQNEVSQVRSSLLDDDMLASLTELTEIDSQGRDYILTPTKVDIRI